MSDQVVTAAQLRTTVAGLVDEDTECLSDQANLFEFGLDSISLMQLVSRWRQAGIEVDFAELARQPTIEAWTRLLRGRAETPAPHAADGDVGASAGGARAGSGGGDRPERSRFPLALMQHAYWVGRGDTQQLGGVAAHLYIEFDGTGVDPQRLRRAVELLVARHDMLRVRITDNGEQEILPESGWRGLTVHDLRELADAEVRRRLDRTRETLSHQLLDIEQGEVFATALSLLPGGRTRLHLDVDMVAADAVSYRVLLADLARLYADPDAALPPIGCGYRDYLAARPDIRRAAAARAAEYWQRRLADLPGSPELPRSLTPAGPPRACRRAFPLPPPLRESLTRAARRRGVTPAMVVTTAFAEVLGAWSAEPRFLLNVPIFDREQVHPDIHRVVGDFTSSVLLEVDLTEPVPFVERVRGLQARLHSDAAHAAYSGVEVLRDLSRQRGEQLIAPVVFTSGLSLGELFDQEVRSHFGDPVWIISQGPQVLLDAQVSEIDGGLLVNWDTRENELAPGVADAMFAAFEHLVRRAAQDERFWDEPVGDLRPQTQREVRSRVNDTTTPWRSRPLHAAFFTAAGRFPDAPAVIGPAGTLSYAELAGRALRLAAALRARGVRPGNSVAVTLPKGAEQVVAVLGVLAAGGVYVPIGVDQPAVRAERITRLAGAAVTVAAGEGPGCLSLERALAEHAPLPTAHLGDPEEPAYLLFTSGSTGQPKGVEVPHRAAVGTLDDLVERFGIGPADRTLALSALDFDLSVFDLFAPLSVGGAVVVIDEATRRDAHRWADLVREQRISVLNCVPALLDMLLSTGAPLGDSLRVVLLGGDWVGVDLPARLARAVPGCRFVGLGGTTETAIHSTVCEVARGAVPPHWTAVPYGTPLHNVRLRVVDATGRDAPDWVPGELWIGGSGVALGYRGDPERTADRFVEYEGLRWYRTGDRARYWPDGTVEFLGRRDNQVKVRGMRIELGEVEAALRADPRVRAAVAVVTGEAAPVLVAAVVPADGVDYADPAVPEGVRATARRLVPAHMVPERVLVLADLPLTANGKLDRRAVRALAEREGIRPSAERVPPRTPLERAIAQVWASVLAVPVEQVGATDSLFALGGDSVLATAIVARLREDLELAGVSARMLFAAPTVAGLAGRILAGEPDPRRLQRVAEIFLEIAALSDDEVDARLGQAVSEA